MSPAEALRQLLRVVKAMDLDDQAQRPTEEEYQAAIAAGEAALMEADRG